MFDNFDFDELMSSMKNAAEEKKPETKKKAEVKKPENKKKTSSAPKTQVPDSVKNAEFKNKVFLITSFGSIELTGDGEKLTSADIRAKLLEGEFLHEAAAPNVYYIKAYDTEGTDVVIAAIDRVASLNGATAGKVSCGEYVMETEGGELEKIKSGWQNFMKNDCSLYKIKDGEFGVYIDAEGTKDLNGNKVLCYEELEAEKSEEFVEKLIGDKCPKDVEARVIETGTEEEDNLQLIVQFFYNGVGKSDGGKEAVKPAYVSQEDKRKQEDAAYFNQEVELPVYILLHYGGDAQPYTSDDFDGKAKITLDELFGKVTHDFPSLCREKIPENFKYVGMVPTPIKGKEEWVRLVEYNNAKKEFARKGACPFS